MFMNQSYFQCWFASASAHIYTYIICMAYVHKTNYYIEMCCACIINNMNQRHYSFILYPHVHINEHCGFVIFFVIFLHFLCCLFSSIFCRLDYNRLGNKSAQKLLIGLVVNVLNFEFGWHLNLVNFLGVRGFIVNGHFHCGVEQWTVKSRKYRIPTIMDRLDRFYLWVNDLRQHFRRWA